MLVHWSGRQGTQAACCPVCKPNAGMGPPHSLRLGKVKKKRHLSMYARMSNMYLAASNLSAKKRVFTTKIHWSNSKEGSTATQLSAIKAHFSPSCYQRQLKSISCDISSIRTLKVCHILFSMYTVIIVYSNTE